VAEPDRQPRGWRSYDSVVDPYDEAAVPRFLPVARDLVAALAPSGDATVLDVGTGTGLTARLMREATGRDGFVVGVDPSVPMLERAVAQGLTAVAGVFPGLPFSDDVFDIVAANLVLSHLRDYHAGVVDAVRVLRMGGRFGCTAWAAAVEASSEHQGPNADEIVQSLLAAAGLDMTPPTPPVPSEEPLRERANLESALLDAGLAGVSLASRTYRWTNSVDDYLVGREWRPGIRYLREQADPQLWQELQDRAASKLREHVGDQIRTMGHIWIAVGTKPQ
jgi:SAM-dependent methyltransferase